MNRNNYTLNFDASLDISQIRSAVAEMQRAFSKVKLSQGLDLNIKETFSNLSNEIANFEELTSKSFHSLSEIGEVSKSFQKILDYYKRLNKYELQITGKDASDFFPKDLVDIISGAEKAVKNYEKVLNSIPTQIQKQTRAIEEQEQALNSLIEKRNDLASENRNLSISRSGLTQKISTRQVEQADISNRMQIAQDSGVKKSSEEYKALVAQYKAVSAEIKSLETELSSLDNKITKNHETMEGLGIQVSSTGSKILELRQELERMGSSLEFEALTKLRTELAQITKQDISQIPRDIQEIKNMINGLSAEELKKIKQAFNEIHTSVENTEAPLQKAKGDIEKLGESGRSIANTADEINNLKNQVLDFFSLSNAVNLFQRALSSALDTVKELDATMTEAAVVTDFSVGDMWNQLPIYSEEATKLGATINDLYGATTLYYQQGLKTNEAMALGIETTKMARIANMETADATDLMTAALRGFNMELNETSAQRINDVYSELAAVTAADTEEIGIAMSKTASLAASANMEFETTAAFLSQIIETTREAPETAGTALKTIVARFTEVKELFSQGELMGEDSEGQEININKIDEALKTVGISLNEFLLGSKGLDDILLELASKWDTLDIATQRYIATTAAGSRQQSRFLAMMSDYDRTMELVDAAYNSTGASQEQFEKTLDSLQSKLNNLKNAWDQFTMGILDSDVIKFGVDLLTQLLNAINNITEALPGPLSGLAKIGIAIGGLKIGKSIFNSLFSSIGKAFLEGGEKAGLELEKGLEKTVNKAFKNVSRKAKSSAKTVLRTLDSEFSKTGSNTFDGLIKAFDKTGNSLFKYSTEMGKDISTAIANSLSKMDLSQEGQEAALEFLIAFEKEVSDTGNFNRALQKLKTNLQSLNIDTSKIIIDTKDMDKFKVSLSSIANGAGKVETILLGLSDVLSSMGFDSAASGVLKLATALGGITNIVSGITSLVSTMSIDFSKAGIAISAAGVAAQISWGWIGVVVAGITALTLGIIALNNSVDDSAARKMEAAKEATEDAEKAAESAQTAYDNLMSSIENYDSAKAALNEMIKYTRDWEQALWEANDATLSLIKQFPKLAKYLEVGENGELSISEEGITQAKESAQQGLKNSQILTFTSNNQMEEAERAQARQILENEYTNNITIGPSDFANSEIESLRDEFVKNPNLFDNVQITQEIYQELSPESQQRLKNDYNMGQLSDEDFLKEINRGNITQYSDTLLSFLENRFRENAPEGGGFDEERGYAQVAEQYASLEGNLLDYINTEKASLSKAAAQLNTMFTAQVDSSIAQEETGREIIQLFSEIKADSYDETIQQTKDNLNLQEELSTRGLTYSGDNLTDLQTLYADLLNINVSEIDDTIAESEDKLKDAIAKILSTNEITDTLENFFAIAETHETKLSQEFIDILSKDASAISGEKIVELLGLDPDGINDYLEKIAKEYDFSSIDELAASLGISVEELTDSFNKSISAIASQQRQTNEDLALKFINTGVLQTGNTQDMLSFLGSLSNEQKDFMNISGESIEEQLGLDAQREFLTGMSDIYLNESENTAKRVENIIDQIDWSNPIQAVGELNDALEDANPSIQALSASLLTAGQDAFSAGEQFRYFLQSSEFSDLQETIDEIVDENGKLTPQNIEELAASSSLLNQMLENVDVSIGGVTLALNALNQGTISIDDITDSLLIALSNFNALDNSINNAYNTMQNFDPGIDEGSIGEWVNDVTDQIEEMYENGEYGNSQLQNYIKMIFGEDQWNQALIENNSNLKKVEEQFVKRLQVLDGNLYGAWEEFATNSKYLKQLDEFNKLNDTNIQLSQLKDGSIHIETNGATTEQMIQAIMDAYDVSKEYAEMLLTDFKNYSADLAQTLNENDWNAGIEDYIKSRTITTGYETDPNQPRKILDRETNRLVENPEYKTETKQMVFSDKEIAAISASTGKEIEEIWIQIANTIKGVEGSFTNLKDAQDYIAQQGAVLQLLDVNGNIKSIDELTQELNTKLGNGSNWATSFKEGIQLELTDLETYLQNLNIPEESIQQMVVQAVEDAGDDTTITVNGVALTDEQRAELGENYEGVFEDAQKNADATLFAEKISEALTGEDIDWSDVQTTANETFNGVYNTVKDYMGDIRSEIDSVNGSQINVGVNIQPNASGIKIGGGWGQPSYNLSVSLYKKGSSRIDKNQLGILGDGNGEELVISEDGSARVVGQNGPELTTLQKGDQIYTAEETKKILQGSNDNEFSAFAGGATGYTRPFSQTNASTKKKKEEEKKTSSSSKKNSSSKSEAEKEAEIWENTFDWLYNLTQDINEELREREKLQTKYNRLIEDESKSATDILNNLREQEASLEQQRKLQQQMYNKRKQEMKNTLSEYKDVSQYATYNWSDNTVEINWDAINKVTDVDKGDRIEEYVSKLEEIESQMDEAQDALDNITDEIEELQKVGQDEYNDLESRVLDAIISREQEKIDKLSLIDESINDANNKLINSIQTNLDRIRQERQNQETEQSIEDNERRLAYLQQDTSGANALEIQRLQEELANQKQDYTDTLIDQKLSAIQEQNDKASEERQYQIELAQAQLEEMQKTGGFWDEAYRLIKEGTDATGKLVSNSELTKLLKEGEAWKSMSNIQQMDWLSELENNTKAAMVYFSNQRQLEKVGKKSGKITFTNANGEKLTGTVQKDGSVKVTTSKGTYTYKEVFQNYDGTYETLESNPSFKASSSSSSSNKGSGSGSIKVGGLINAGKAKIYDYAGDKSGERQYFLNDPIYKVLSEKNGYLLTRWHKLNTGYTGWFKKSDVKAYAKGGLADFTGPAWLDGTKSKPELVLNAKDTQNFIQLKDILSSLLKGDSSATGNNGDNYFEIHIDVDSLNNDYDVEQLATKIKKMINDDARYRNVNSINLLR